MKLIFCTECHDVFRLLLEEDRKCICGKSGGKYINSLEAVMYGKSIPIGFNNGSFVKAIKNQPEFRPGERFEAFVIEKHCPTIKLQ